MKRLYLLVEGQTEETFVREVLVPQYASSQLYLTPILLSTSPGFKGGVTSYAKVKPQIMRLCRQDRDAVVTTMIDLYALPRDFPGRLDSAYPSNGSGAQKALFLEGRLASNIAERNFMPFIMAHEFEALLFSDPDKFGDWADSAYVVERLRSIAASVPSPEDINDTPQRAPSKRIVSEMPSYEKTFHGPLIAAEIGLSVLRQRCGHFSAWLTQLESFIAST